MRARNPIWSWWRTGFGVAACACAITASAGLRTPLATMTGYTASLMALNQLVPPLLLVAIPPRWLSRWRGAPAPDPAPGLRGWLLDPLVAGSVFTALTIGISVPAVLDTSLAEALFAAPLGMLELLAGLLLWAQLVPVLRTIDSDWKTGVFAFAAGLPMAVVAVVWMVSPSVLYTPYLDVICRWNVTPLQDQHWAGFVMLVAGLPLQAAGIWFLTGAGTAAAR